ncbi:MAG: trigger factor [Verrucomicrobiota bacterium]
MKVTTEQKETCIVDLHIELPPERFQSEWKEVGNEYRRQANLPGFRKGKAPLAIVEKKYGPDIEQEVTRKLLDAAVREVLNEQKLSPVQSPNVHDVKLEGDRSLSFTATVVVRPPVNLPDYKGLVITVEKPAVDEEQVAQFLDGLRGDMAEFKTVEGRDLAMGDFAVLDYEGSIEGKALADTYPDLQPTYLGRKNFWIKLEEDRPIPGLAAAMVGLKTGEMRDCTVSFPTDFGEEKLRGYKVTYKVTLHEIKERELPPIDDAFAAKLSPGSTLEQIRGQVRERLTVNANQNFASSVRGEAVKQLLAMVSFDAPSSMVQQESTAILKEIIQENQSRGVSEEELRSHQEELLGAARQSAGDKVKLNFILGEIVVKEDIRVSREELAWRITNMAERYQMTPQKLLKELQKHRAIAGIEEEISLGKALDVVVSHARVNGEDPKPTATNPENTHSHDEEPHVHGPGCGHDH